jgi:polar amino acid transport system substrate-binding protein
MTHRATGWFACITVTAIVLAGCGGGSKSSSSSNSTSTTATTSSKVAAEVPAAFKSKGTLVVAMDATYAPLEFFASNGRTVIGMDADLAKALTGVMGLKAKVVNANFDSILPGLTAKKYDLGMSSFTDTREREKVVDFVTYYQAGSSFYTKATGAPTINTLADLCGHTVAAEKGTTQAADATAQSKKCKAAGKPAVKLLVYPDQNGVNLALSSGRAQVDMADSPIAEYQAKKSNGQFKVVGKTYGPFPYGVAIPKGSGMPKPILDAVKELMSNGKYTAILKKWGIQSGAISNPKINGAIN